MQITKLALGEKAGDATLPEANENDALFPPLII